MTIAEPAVHASPRLGEFLDQIAGRYGADYLYSDPLGRVHHFKSQDDLEVAGFLAAGLALGRVETILAKLDELWERLDFAPARSADHWVPSDHRRLRGFRHRWIEGSDVGRVLAALGRCRREYGSLRELFAKVYRPAEPNLSGAASRFVDAVAARVPGRRPLPRGTASFLVNPKNGSACKRLNLYLRWMVRPCDGVDLGVFSKIDPAKLIMPLDTHIARIGGYLGLTNRSTADLKMAEEITRSLSQFNSGDPVGYDFALSRLGILKECPVKVNPKQCRPCVLLPVCRKGRQTQ